MGATWGQLWPTRPNLPQVGHLGATSAQVELHVGSTRGTWPAQYESVTTRFQFSVFFVLMTLHVEQCFPCCVSVGPNLVRSCRQRGPSPAMLNMTRTSTCITWLPFGSIWINLGPTSAQHDSLSGAVRAQARPNLWLTPRDTLLCKVLWLSLGFVALKRSAQARPKLARGRPNFGQGLPSLTPVGCHLELG